MQTISEHTGQLVFHRCWCGIQHAIPQSLHDETLRRKENGQKPLSVFCPLGHSWILTVDETDAQREARQLRILKDRIQANLDQKNAELRDTKNTLNATKAAKSRLKNRIKNGVCPCCNRHFKNVANHMRNQHPEEFAEEAKGTDQ